MAGPSAARNFLGGLVDRVALGNNYDRQTGQFSNVGRGLFGRGLGIVTSAVGGPLVGGLVNMAAGNYIDTGSVTRGGYGAGPLARLLGRDANSVGQVERQPLTVPGLSLNLGLPSVGNVAPTYNGAANPQPYNAWTPSSDWGAAQMAGTGDKPPSPFSAEGAYNSTNAPSTGGTSYDPTSATNQAWLFTNNMNRMNAMARDAIQKRMR